MPGKVKFGVAGLPSNDVMARPAMLVKLFTAVRESGRRGRGGAFRGPLDHTETVEDGVPCSSYGLPANLLAAGMAGEYDGSGGVGSTGLILSTMLLFFSDTLDFLFFSATKDFFLAVLALKRLVDHLLGVTGLERSAAEGST